MESEVQKSCQWKHCEKSASMHVIFGTRVFDPPEDLHVSNSPNKPEHLDLCLKHIDLIRLQFIHVNLMELGSCPMHSQN